MCGSYGGGDVHEGGGGRTTQEVSPVPHQQNEVLEGRSQGTGSNHLPPVFEPPSSPGLCHLQSVFAHYARMKGEALGDVIICSDVM